MKPSNNMRLDRFSDLLGEIEEVIPDENMEKLMPVFMEICDLYELEVLRNEEVESKQRR